MRIPGHYVYDDDSLRPGNHKAGGLHQNLFDADGDLKASARFIPSDPDKDDDLDEFDLDSAVFIPLDEPGFDEEQTDLVTVLVTAALTIGVTAAAKAGTAWWEASGREQVGQLFSRVRLPFQRQRDQERVEASVPETETSVQRLVARRPPMPEAEAKARLLAALAARVYAEQQLHLVMGSDIVGGKDTQELEASLRVLPEAELRQLLAHMAQDPTLLTEGSLASLAGTLHKMAELSLQVSQSKAPGGRRLVEAPDDPQPTSD